MPGNAARREDPRSSTIEELVTSWARTIRAAAAKYGIAGPDLDEVAQDVRVRLWRALEQHGKPASALTAAYAYRAATSAAIDLLRRRRAEQPQRRAGFEEAVAVVAGPGAGAADESAILDRLETALAMVPESRRPAVRLHLEGKHVSEIANLLGWTPAAARNRLYRGLDDLRTALRDETDADRQP